MKKLLIILLLTTATAQAKPLFLFTDTKQSSGQLPIQDQVTWIFEEKSISLITETQDVKYSVLRHEKVQGLITTYNKYYLENGYAIYVNTETLEVIFTTETSQYLFRVNDNKLLTKNQ